MTDMVIPSPSEGLRINSARNLSPGIFIPVGER